VSALRAQLIGLGGVVVATVVLVALLAPVLAPHSLTAFDLAHRLSPPIWDAGGASGTFPRCLCSG